MLTSQCELGNWKLPLQCRRPLPCDLRHFDPGAQFNRKLLQRARSRVWAKNNEDAPNRHYQYGVEWWLYRALPPPTTNQSELANARSVFISSFDSYAFIFEPQRAQKGYERALADLPDMAGRPARYVFSEHHPGACLPATAKHMRLIADEDLTCKGGAASVPVPYVVSRPAWLVAPELPRTNRSTLLFFRGHLPRSTIDTKQVRRNLLLKLQGLPGVQVEAATAQPGAVYEPHDAYLAKMMRAAFCLAPRGDTASSKRLYEAIAAGCVPVIISDTLRLPFERRLRWADFSIRMREDDVLKAPARLDEWLRELTPERVLGLQTNLERVRRHFIWHLDPTRESAVDQIITDICEGPPLQMQPEYVDF